MLTRKRCRCHEKVFISCLSPCGWCNTRRVMVEQAENIWACSRIFRRLRHQWLAETFASTARGLYWFLSIRYFLNDNTDNGDNRNRKGNLSCLCFMSPRDIPQLRPSFLLFLLSVLSSKIIRRFLSLSITSHFRIFKPYKTEILLNTLDFWDYFSYYASLIEN